MAEPVLSVHGLTKQFAGTLALDRVDFEVRPGEIHALVGENGAGKSTLIKVLARVYEADAGEITIAGRPLAAYADPLGPITPCSTANRSGSRPRGRGRVRRTGPVCSSVSVGDLPRIASN